MTNLKNRFTHQVTQYDKRLSKLEVSEVDSVRWYKVPYDKNHNDANIVARDRRHKKETDSEGNQIYPYLRPKIPSIVQSEGYWGKYQGHPKVIRRGNTVKTVFYKQEKPQILSPVESKFEPPVCRPDPYTERTKYCQYRPLPFGEDGIQDMDLDFVKPYPNPKKPVCKNWQHGPCFGDKRDDEKEPTLGRDYWFVFDYCQEGDVWPDCSKCVNIDWPKRNKNTWMKSYSHNTMSCEAPNKRFELHTYDGSSFRFENETGNSDEYSEGIGHIRLENAKSETDRKGHLNFYPTGSIDIHTVPEDGKYGTTPEKEQVHYGSIGKQIIAVSGSDHTVLDEDDEQVACRMIHFDKQSFIEILEDGKIKIKSGSATATITVDGPNNTITMHGTENVIINADTKIELNSPYIETNGDYWCFKHTKIYHGDIDNKIHCICGEEGCEMCNPPP